MPSRSSSEREPGAPSGATDADGDAQAPVPHGFRALRTAGDFIHVNGPLYLYHQGDDVRLGFRVEKRHTNPMGTLHGGVICDLADAAMGVAIATTLEDDESFTTIDLTAKYFKPIWNAKIRASATAFQKSGR